MVADGHIMCGAIRHGWLLGCCGARRAG
jgi:hypothetical protein